MKRIMNTIVAVALLFGVTTAAQAQSVENKYPYNFVSLQGGAQATLTHYKFTDLITPQAAVSFGRYFNSKVGARLHVQGWQIKSGFKQDRFAFLTEDKGYKFNAITGDLDLLVNMTNVLNPNRINDKFDWVLLAGFGVNYAWDFDEFNEILPLINANNYYVGPEMCGTKHSTFNGRFGTQFNFNLSKCLALGLELDANYKNDEFNLKRNYNPDWQVQALLGLTFKFGGPKEKATKPVQTPVVQETIQEEVAEVAPAAPAVVEKKMVKKEVTREEAVKLHKEVFYAICVSENESPSAIMEQVANFLKQNKNAKVTVVGYADKGTGNAKVNEMYAKKRAEQFKKDLIDRYGIDGSLITTDSKGDTVQPFAENDKNRCVIIDGEGVRVYKEIIEVEE